MAAGDDIFQQYRNAGDGRAAPASAATSPAPSASSATAPPSAKSAAGDDIFQQYRANPPSTTAPPSPTPQQPSGPEEAYGMTVPAFAPGTTGRDIANAAIGGIYSVGANVARNLGITPNALPADVQATMAAHPNVTTAGNLLGQAAVGAPLALGAEVAAPAIYGGVGLGGAGWLPTLARGAITGAGVGAVQNALAGDPQESLLTRARIGAEWGAPFGLLGEGAGKALGAEAGPVASSADMPSVPAGSVRLYHGGVDPASGGARWVTPDYQYARDWSPSGAPVSYADVPLDHPAVQQATDTINVQPGQPPRVVAFNAPEDIAKQLKPVPTQPAPPATADAVKAIANAKYAQADAAGGTLTPQFTDKFLDSISQSGRQTGAGRATVGPTEVSQLLDRYNNGPDAIRGQPLSLQSVQEIDEGLGDLIDRHFDRVNGMDKEGQKLLQVQSNLRSMIDNAQPGDISGSTAGFDALVDGRKAWSQYRKMDDLERMKARADGTQNPTTSFRTQVNNLVNNPSRVRGYSPEEIAAVKAAADRGVIGGALHIMGSRLLPHVAGAVGASIGGVPGFIAGEALAHFGGAGARTAANALQTGRFNRMMGTFGSSVPPNALTPP